MTRRRAGRFVRSRPGRYRGTGSIRQCERVALCAGVPCSLVEGLAHQLQDDVSAIEQLHFKPGNAALGVLIAMFSGLHGAALASSGWQGTAAGNMHC